MGRIGLTSLHVESRLLRSRVMALSPLDITYLRRRVNPPPDSPHAYTSIAEKFSSSAAGDAVSAAKAVSRLLSVGAPRHPMEMVHDLKQKGCLVNAAWDVPAQSLLGVARDLLFVRGVRLQAETIGAREEIALDYDPLARWEILRYEYHRATQVFSELLAVRTPKQPWSLAYRKRLETVALGFGSPKVAESLVLGIYNSPDAELEEGDVYMALTTCGRPGSRSFGAVAQMLHRILAKDPNAVSPNSLLISSAMARGVTRSSELSPLLTRWYEILDKDNWNGGDVVASGLLESVVTLMCAIARCVDLGPSQQMSKAKELYRAVLDAAPHIAKRDSHHVQLLEALLQVASAAGRKTEAEWTFRLTQRTGASRSRLPVDVATALMHSFRGEEDVLYEALISYRSQGMRPSGLSLAHVLRTFSSSASSKKENPLRAKFGLDFPTAVAGLVQCPKDSALFTSLIAYYCDGLCERNGRPGCRAMDALIDLLQEFKDSDRVVYLYQEAVDGLERLVTLLCALPAEDVFGPDAVQCATLMKLADDVVRPLVHLRLDDEVHYRSRNEMVSGVKWKRTGTGSLLTSEADAIIHLAPHQLGSTLATMTKQIESLCASHPNVPLSLSTFTRMAHIEGPPFKELKQLRTNWFTDKPMVATLAAGCKPGVHKVGPAENVAESLTLPTAGYLQLPDFVVPDLRSEPEADVTSYAHRPRRVTLNVL